MLKRIEVKNFKSLKHVDFKCAGLNLLMGLNGAGKSSFVQLLEMMRVVAGHGTNGVGSIPMREIGGDGKFSDLKYCYAPGDADIEVGVDFKWRDRVREIAPGRYVCAFSILNHLKNVESPDADAVEISNVQRISRSFQGDGRGGILSIHPSVRDKILHSNEFREYQEFVSKHGGERQIEKLPASDVNAMQYAELRHKLSSLKSQILKGIEEQDKQVAEEFADLWEHAQRIDAFRGKAKCVHQGGHIDIRRGDKGNLRFNSEGEDVVEFLDKFGEEVVLYKDNPMRRCGGDAAESCLFDEVNSWMSVVSPGVSLNIERVQCGDDELLVEKFAFGDGDEKRSFKPQNVGFGISYTLPVIVALLTAEPEDIIIIENPEAHLHPKGQAQMGELIARAANWGVQLFVETHSDHVVNGIRSAVKDGIVKPSDVNVAFFERKEHDVLDEDGSTHQEIYSEMRNIKVDKNGSLSEYPNDFMDEWNNQLMELL